VCDEDEDEEDVMVWCWSPWRLSITGAVSGVCRDAILMKHETLNTRTRRSAY